MRQAEPIIRNCPECGTQFKIDVSWEPKQAEREPIKLKFGIKLYGAVPDQDVVEAARELMADFLSIGPGGWTRERKARLAKEVSPDILVYYFGPTWMATGHDALVRSDWIEQHHPDWILKDKNGNPATLYARAHYLLLDPRIPEVRDFLIDRIVNVVQDDPHVAGYHGDWVVHRPTKGWLPNGVEGGKEQEVADALQQYFTDLSGALHNYGKRFAPNNCFIDRDAAGERIGLLSPGLALVEHQWTAIGESGYQQDIDVLHEKLLMAQDHLKQGVDYLLEFRSRHNRRVNLTTNLTWMEEDTRYAIHCYLLIVDPLLGKPSGDLYLVNDVWSRIETARHMREIIDKHSLDWGYPVEEGPVLEGERLTRQYSNGLVWVAPAMKTSGFEGN